MVLGVLVSAALYTEAVEAVDVRLDAFKANIVRLHRDHLVGLVKSRDGSEKSKKSDKHKVELHDCVDGQG